MVAGLGQYSVTLVPHLCFLAPCVLMQSLVYKATANSLPQTVYTAFSISLHVYLSSLLHTRHCVCSLDYTLPQH